MIILFPLYHVPCACFSQNFQTEKRVSPSGLKDDNAWTWNFVITMAFVYKLCGQTSSCPFFTFVDVFDTKIFPVLNYVYIYAKVECNYCEWKIQILSENRILGSLAAIFFWPLVHTKVTFEYVNKMMFVQITDNRINYGEEKAGSSCTTRFLQTTFPNFHIRSISCV